LLDPGLAIIHSNEPQQMVYLDRSALVVIDVYSEEEKNSIVKALMAEFAKDFKIRKEYKPYNKETVYSFVEISPKERRGELWFNVAIGNGSIGVKVGEKYKMFYDNDEYKISDIIKYIKENLPNIKPSVTTINNELMLNMSKVYGLKLEGDTIKGVYKPKKSDGLFKFNITHDHYQGEGYGSNNLYFNISKQQGKFKTPSGKVYKDDYSSSFMYNARLDMTDAHIPKTREGFDYYLEQLFSQLNERLINKKENFKQSSENEGLRYSSYLSSERKSIEDMEKFINFLKTRVFKIMS
jgi:hypothetical protein